jgi:bacteriocin-like protein
LRAEQGANIMRELTEIPMNELTELTDAELEAVSGGAFEPHPGKPTDPLNPEGHPKGWAVH